MTYVRPYCIQISPIFDCVTPVGVSLAHQLLHVSGTPPRTKPVASGLKEVKWTYSVVSFRFTLLFKKMCDHTKMGEEQKSGKGYITIKRVHC